MAKRSIETCPFYDLGAGVCSVHNCINKKIEELQVSLGEYAQSDRRFQALQKISQQPIICAKPRPQSSDPEFSYLCGFKSRRIEEIAVKQQQNELWPFLTSLAGYIGLAKKN